MTRYSASVIFLLILLPLVSRGQGIEVAMENDAFYFPNPTDRFYSNGIELQYSGAIHQRAQQQEQWIFTGTHRIYNGLNNASSEIPEYDRPYAGVLLISAERLRIIPSDHSMNSLSASLGWMGSLAQGNELQNGFHDLLENSNEAFGWDRQLEDMPVVQLEVSTGKFIQNNLVALGGAVGGNLGTLETSVYSSADVYVGFLDRPFSPRDQSRRFVQVHGQIMVKGVGYDATLQGSPFLNDSNAIARQDLMRSRLQAGLMLELQQSGVSFSAGFQWNSPEMKNMPSHAIGLFRVGYFF